MNFPLQFHSSTGTLKIFGLPVSTDFSLGSLPTQSSQSDCDQHPPVRIRIHRNKHLLTNVHWLPPQQDDEWYTVGKVTKRFLLRFANSADFLICLQSKSIDCYPDRTTNIETVQHLLLNQVLPRYLAQIGTTVLHASAVSIEGDAIAFLGDTGSGKSTFATNFCQHGASLLTDDCLVVDTTTTPPKAVPSYPGIRLREDGWNQIPESIGKTRPAAQYSAKMFLGDEQLPFPFCEHSENLTAIYQLAPSEDSSVPVAITPLSKREALHHLVQNSFRLDFTDRQLMQREFHQLVLLTKNTPLFSLTYPRSWEHIDQLRKTILEHAQDLESIS